MSTGSTAARIADAGVPVTEVADLTGFPECLDGRVKTLHPRVHAGILADLRLDDHHSQLEALGIEPFELVVVNLYPFTQTVASGASPDECIEQIDIGGPSMVRGAAKNHANVAVVTSPAAYDEVIAAVRGEGFTLAQRARLAAEAFVHTATYDIAVASWMGERGGPDRRGLRVPRLGRCDLGPCRCPALRREPPPGRRALHLRARPRRTGLGRAAARQGDVVQQLRRRRCGVPRGLRLRRAGGRDHQARQPVRHRDRRRHRPGARPRARHRPGVGVRRGHRGEPPGHGGDGRAGRRGVHRGRRGAGLRR